MYKKCCMKHLMYRVTGCVIGEHVLLARNHPLHSLHSYRNSFNNKRHYEYLHFYRDVFLVGVTHTHTYCFCQCFTNQARCLSVCRCLSGGNIADDTNAKNAKPNNSKISKILKDKVFVLRQARHILDRFCFALRLIQAPNKRAGYQLVASKTIHRTMIM